MLSYYRVARVQHEVEEEMLAGLCSTGLSCGD